MASGVQVVTLMASLVLAAACVSTRGAVPTAVTITSEHAGRAIDLRRDQVLLVRLPTNPVTGYRWSLVVAPGDVLRLEGGPSAEGGNFPGGQGIEVWRFRCARAGQQTLRFEYRRPWDTYTPAVQQLAYAVTVR